MHILGSVWSRKMDLSSVNWMHAEGTMSRQTYQPLVCTCFPHPSLCLQSYLKNAERYEPQTTVENTPESQFFWNIDIVLSGYVRGAETYWKQASIAVTLVRVSTLSHGNVIVSVKIYSPSCKGAHHPTRTLLLLGRVTFACTLLMKVIGSSLENHTQKFD